MLRPIVNALAALVTLISGKRGDDNVDVVEGGVYASADPDGEYTISKVLVADDSAVHLRFYEESFKSVPTAVDTSKLTISIGHAPLAREGFLKDQPKLISVEKVAESELEGYRYYLEAIGAAD
jgi:hypothetical protein